MDKYWAFRQMLDFMADHAEVVDADLNWCGKDNCKITGETDDEIIDIEIRIEKKEEKQDGN